MSYGGMKGMGAMGTGMGNAGVASLGRKMKKGRRGASKRAAGGIRNAQFKDRVFGGKGR